MKSYWYIDDDGAQNCFRTLYECKQKFMQIVSSASKPSKWNGTVLVHYDSVKECVLSCVECRVFFRTFKDCLGFYKEVLIGVNFSRPL